MHTDERNQGVRVHSASVHFKVFKALVYLRKYLDLRLPKRRKSVSVGVRPLQGPV